VAKLDRAASSNEVLDMETEFCSVALDIIGKAVFNYDFGSVTKESPVVKAVYRALQEAEHRSTSFIPYWKLPFAKFYLKNLQDFDENMKLLNSVLNELIAKAFASQNRQDVSELESRDYGAGENASLLRFLVDMRGENATSLQLRDDLMTMLIAGHETSAALLTWTFFELGRNPALLRRVQAEIDAVLQGRAPTLEDMMNLPLLRSCLAETLRMYPEPPLLIRRALEDDTLPQGGAAGRIFLPRGTDVFISTWNMHHSPEFWEHPEVYNPDRFLRNFTNPKQADWAGYTPGSGKQMYPNEVHADFAFLPFGGGSRKCIGDQFAMMETLTTVALILQRFDVRLAVPAEQVGMRTGACTARTSPRVFPPSIRLIPDYGLPHYIGATIHTENGLMMRVTRREEPGPASSESAPVAESAKSPIRRSTAGGSKRKVSVTASATSAVAA
jgi:cytochrome P450